MSNEKLKVLCISTSVLIGSIFSMGVFADDGPSETCASAASLIEEGDVDGALEEARWCVTQLEQIKQKEVAAFFKDNIDGYVGGELNQQQAMGVTVVERGYTKDGAMINVSLTGGASQAASNAFSALASMGMQMGSVGTKVRIQKRSGVINDEDGSNQVIVTLKSGGLLTFSSSDISSDSIVAFAKKFPVADLDDSRN